MAVLTFSDSTGSYECLLFSEQLSKYGDMLQPGTSVILDVEAEVLADGIRLRLLRCRPLENIANSLPAEMTIFVSEEKCLDPASRLLETGGNGTVFIVVRSACASRESRIKLAGKYKLSPDLVCGLKSIAGINDVKLD